MPHIKTGSQFFKPRVKMTAIYGKMALYGLMIFHLAHPIDFILAFHQKMNA